MLNTPPSAEANTSDFESMCEGISQLRDRARSLAEEAQGIENRLLGPVPEEDNEGCGVPPSLSFLTGAVNGTVGEIRESHSRISRSLDRISRELGAIGD